MTVSASTSATKRRDEMTRTVSPAPYGVPGLEFGNTSEYPYRPGRPHGGQDHQWRYADVARSRQTYAPVTGVVTAAYNDGGDHNGWGNYVDIDVPTVDGTSVHARLAHHETGSVRVRVGDRVTAGVTRIGTMGDTGEAGGIHLHEELWINGRRVDPVYYRTHDIPGTPATSGDNARPFNPETKSEEDDMAAPIRIISAPAWEAAGKRLITNGSSVLEVPAGAAQVLIQNGVPYRIYEGDNANTDMLYEVSVNWALGGLDAGTVAEKVKGITQTVDVDSAQIAEDIASRLKILAS